MADVGRPARLVATLAVIVAGCCACGTGRDDSGHRGATVGDGPLIADTGEGATISRPVKRGKPTSTITFGTVLCTDDPDAGIVIDDVRYDTMPELPENWSPDARDVPSIGTWLRAVPPPDDDQDETDNNPIIGIRGTPQRLSGDVGPLEDGLPAPITHDCKDYLAADRTFPIVELLTVMTVDERGSTARRTYIDYHAGDENYTLTVNWEVGFCGTEVRDSACRRR